MNVRRSDEVRAKQRFTRSLMGEVNWIASYRPISRWGVFASILYLLGASIGFTSSLVIADSAARVADAADILSSSHANVSLFSPTTIVNFVVATLPNALAHRLRADLLTNLTTCVVIGILLNGIAQLMRASAHGAASRFGKGLDGFGKSIGVFGWSLGVTGTVGFALRDERVDSPLVAWAVSAVMLPPLIIFLVSALTSDRVKDIKKAFMGDSGGGPGRPVECQRGRGGRK